VSAAPAAVGPGDGLVPDSTAALRAGFNPAAIAVVGASRTPGKMGHVMLRALVESGFGGQLYPVNSAGGVILGLPGYGRVADLPAVPDLALIAVPRPGVADAVLACAIHGVPLIQVMTSGYGETGGRGLAAERELAEVARAHGSRLVGPNCVGLFSASARLTWTPQADFAIGGVSFVSQSGGLAYDLLAGGRFHGLAFDKVASVGNCADLDIGDYLRFLRLEPSTTAVGLYLEGPRDARLMFEELSALAAVKPVLVLKGGRSDAASASVTSHTGRIAGSYRVWRAAVRQAGAAEVRSFAELVAGLTAMQTLPTGPRRRIALVGNGGGATVLAADSCAEHGLQIAPASAGTAARLASVLAAVDGYGPAGQAIVELPIDQLLARHGELLAEVVAALRADPVVDATILHVNLVPLADRNDVPAAMRAVFGRLAAVMKTGGPPVVLVLRAGADPRMASVRQELTLDARTVLGVPVFHDVDEAISGLAIASELRGRPDRLAAAAAIRQPDAGRSAAVRRPGRAQIHAARARADAALDEAEAKGVLARYGLAVPRGTVVPPCGALPALPPGVGPPYVLKALARIPLHKTELGAVRTGIGSVAELSAALEHMRSRMSAASVPVHGYLVEELIPAGREVIIGSTLDEAFGRVAVVGLGGTLVEVMNRVVVRLWPFSAADADEMIADLGPEFLAPGGSAGRDAAALRSALLAVSGPRGLLSAIHDLVTEVDLNPVIVHAGRATVADARIVLRTDAERRRGGGHHG
jgi:acyl-CoA synthetase (NDP forming)